MNDEKICIEKIDKFFKLEKENGYYNEDIDKVKYLINFNFGDLWNRDHKYRCFRDAKDEDSLWLVKYIDYLIWYKKLKLKNLDEMNDLYGGETINTYSTLLGSNNEGYNKFFNKPTKSDENLIKLFRQKYLTIGNFMLLPKKRVSGHNSTLNQLKKSSYQDYSDLFLKDLFNTNKNCELIGKLREINNIDKESFCTTFFLENYIEKDFNIFKYPNKIGAINWQYLKLEYRNEYIKFVRNYIKNSLQIITYRAEKIYPILKDFIS